MVAKKVKIQNELAGIATLLIHPDPKALRQLKQNLLPTKARFFLAPTVNCALEIVEKESIQIVLVHADILNQNQTLMSAFLALQPAGLLYCFANKLSAEQVKAAIQNEATDVISPLTAKTLIQKTSLALRKRITSLQPTAPIIQFLQNFIIFRSEIMKKGLAILPKVAISNYTVLITGESGTGKELVARAIHALSPVADNPFIAVNCGAIPENLIESELFGFEKGTFTGAVQSKKGKFELAQNGTLFLDEIGEMPLQAQVRLLRVLEDQQMYRLGAERPIQLKVRVVAATRANLQQNMQEKLFREDLYYRLNILNIQLPPLRDRHEDIALLAWHFLERAFKELKHPEPLPYLDQAAISILENHAWPGNVRELRNLMTRLAALLPEDCKKIDPSTLQNFLTDLNPAEPSLAEPKGLFLPAGTNLALAERKLIEQALRNTAGNRLKAAKILGISDRTLRRKLNSQS